MIIWFEQLGPHHESHQARDCAKDQGCVHIVLAYDLMVNRGNPTVKTARLAMLIVFLVSILQRLTFDQSRHSHLLYSDTMETARVLPPLELDAVAACRSKDNSRYLGYLCLLDERLVY
jgi:hypothetical protein